MSRSYRHTPKTPVCMGRDRAKAHKKAKKQKMKWERQWLASQDFSTMETAYYKKFCHSYHWDPNDGKMWHDCEMGRKITGNSTFKFRSGYKFNRK